MDRTMPAGSPRGAADRCPRCGAAFHCGRHDATPCACAGPSLTPALQAQLRARYTGCLCLGCLVALAAGSALDVPGVSAAPAGGAC